jgi:putative transposase
VRARMVAHPADYRWSSYRAHAHGAADALVSDHSLYHALGRGAAERRTAYQGLFQTALEPGFVNPLRAATNGGWALGGASFERQLADTLRRRVTPLPRGRPRRERGAKQQLNLL